MLQSLVSYNIYLDHIMTYFKLSAQTTMLYYKILHSRINVVVQNVSKYQNVTQCYQLQHIFRLLLAVVTYLQAGTIGCDNPRQKTCNRLFLGDIFLTPSSLARWPVRPNQVNFCFGLIRSSLDAQTKKKSVPNYPTVINCLCLQLSNNCLGLKLSNPSICVKASNHCT